MTAGIKKNLKGVQTALQLQLLVNWAVRGLLAGALLALLLMILGKLVPLAFDVVRVSAMLLVTGLATGAVVSLLKPISVFDAAFACDVRLKLKERITSAIEFGPEEHTNLLIPALIQDAERHAKRIRPRRDFPTRLPREALYALALLAIIAGLYFVPPWRFTFASDETREEFTQVQAEAQRVRDIAREITINPPTERTEFAEEIERELNELARDMQFGTLTRREALERLSAIEEAIDRNQDESGYNQLRERLNQMAEALGQAGDLQEAANALANGDSQAASEALNRLANDLESGRVPVENLNDIAESLDRAASSLAGDPSMSDLRDSLAQARDELRAASGSDTETDPAEMARSLIDAINRALPEIQSLDIAQSVKDRATEILESVREDLQQALDSGEVTRDDIASAQQRIQEVRRMLEEAGANLGGEQQDERSTEDVARELVEEADRLESAGQNNTTLDSQTRSDLQSTCRNVARELQEQIDQGACSAQSNEEARRTLDEVRRQLEEAGCSQQQMGQRTQCSGGQRSGGQQASGSQPRSCPGLQGLLGQQSGNQGSQGSGRSGQGREGREGGTRSSCSSASSALKRAGECLGRSGQCMGSGSCFSKIKSRIQQSRCNLSGAACQSGASSQAGRAESAWGVGTTPYAVSPSRITSGHYSENSQAEGKTPDDSREYTPLYSSGFKPAQSYETQLEGKFTDVGGSYVFTEIVDPNTGETSYVPYFSLEPSDVTALMDAVEDQDIPRSYADFVRFYFEQLALGSAASSEAESQ